MRRHVAGPRRREDHSGTIHVPTRTKSSDDERPIR